KNTTVQGNLIGTTADGMHALGNAAVGVFIQDETTGNLVGGTTAAQRNVIAGTPNAGDGVRIIAANSNTVEGNFIGVAADGSTALGNAGNGWRSMAGPPITPWAGRRRARGI